MKNTTANVCGAVGFGFLLGFVGFFSVGMWAACHGGHDKLALFCLWAFPICVLLGIILMGISACSAGKAIGRGVANIIVSRAAEEAFKK